MKDIWCETDSKFILISYISYSLQSPAGNPSPEQKAGSQSPEEQEEGAEVWFSESREGGLTLLLPPWQGWWGYGGSVSGVGEDHRKGYLAHSGADGKSWLQGSLLSKGKRGCGCVLRLGEEETVSESQAVHWFLTSFLQLILTKNSIQRGRE